MTWIHVFEPKWCHKDSILFLVVQSVDEDVSCTLMGSAGPTQGMERLWFLLHFFFP